jgi:hypothetical protein
MWWDKENKRLRDGVGPNGEDKLTFSDVVDAVGTNIIGLGLGCLGMALMAVIARNQVLDNCNPDNWTRIKHW